MKQQNPDYREQIAHGDSLLPVSYYCCHIPGKFRTVPLHWHEEVEFTYIEAGSAQYTIDFETFPAETGDLLLLSPQALHGVQQRQGETMTSHTLVFHLNFLGCLIPDICTVKYLNPILSGKCRLIPVVKPGHPGYEEMKGWFLEACQVFHEKGEAYELRTRACLTELLAAAYLHGCVETTERNTGSLYAEEKLKELLTYIQAHYSDPISIRELAEVCHFSETYLMRFFRRYTGITCVEFINRYRLSRAAAALEETNLPIMNVALENGFRNVSYFDRLFQKQFGRTPGAYRKESRQSP